MAFLWTCAVLETERGKKLVRDACRPPQLSRRLRPERAGRGLGRAAHCYYENGEPVYWEKAPEPPLQPERMGTVPCATVAT